MFIDNSIDFLQTVKSNIRQELDYAGLHSIQLDYYLTT